ncbi:MAG TPA: cupin domain-containing protein [Alphaproteobacteria bacterium]
MISKTDFVNAAMTQTNEQLLASIRSMPEYTMGGKSIDAETPWGAWETTNVVNTTDDQDICEKDITVNPGYALSVQSHVGRGEVWQAVKGTLTALLDGELHTVPQGNSITIPRGAIHAMINIGKEPIIVHEIQSGICREKDNTRWFDPCGGRPVTPSSDERVLRSIETVKRELIAKNLLVSPPQADALKAKVG